MFTLHRNFFLGYPISGQNRSMMRTKALILSLGTRPFQWLLLISASICWKQHPFLQRHASGRLRSYSISRAAPPLCNCSNGSSCSCGAAVAAATAGVLAPAAVAAILQQLLSLQQLLWPLPQQLLWQLSLQLWLQCF